LEERARELDKWIGRASWAMGPGAAFSWRTLAKKFGKEKVLLALAEMVDDPQVMQAAAQAGDITLGMAETAVESRASGKGAPMKAAANSAYRRWRP
jgi:hypothetical protein